jgi:DNA mismatch repair protein MutS2
MQLEFEKVKTLLAEYCRTEYAKQKANNLRIHTKKEFIETELQQTNEYKLLLQGGQYFPNDFAHNISKELKLLSIPGAVLSGEQFLFIKKLAENTGNIFRWFDNEIRLAYPALKNNHRTHQRCAG